MSAATVSHIAGLEACSKCGGLSGARHCAASEVLNCVCCTALLAVDQSGRWYVMLLAPLKHQAIAGAAG